MQPDVLRDLQERGRFFWGMFPGAKASDEWQRQRDRLEPLEVRTAASNPAPIVRDGHGEN